MRSRIPFLLRLIAVVLLSVIILFGLMRRYSQISASLPNIVATQIASTLGRPTKVGSVSMISLNRISIKDIQVANGPSFKNGVLLSIPKTSMSINLVDILTGRLTINSVDLYNPDLRLVRFSSKQWNVTDIVTRPRPITVRFRGMVRIHSGKVRVDDYSARTVTLPQVNRLVTLSGLIDLRPSTFAVLDISGVGTNGRFDRIRAFGRWSTSASNTAINITLTRASAPYWLDYFTDIKSWNLTRGYADIRGNLTRSSSGRYCIQGSAQLRDSVFSSPYATRPVRPFAANIAFINGNLSIAARGYLQDSPILLRGKILDIFHPTLDLKAESSSLDLAILQQTIRGLPRTPQLQWVTRGTATVSITGRPGKLAMDAIVRTPSTRLYGVLLTDVAATGRYSAGQLSVTNLSAKAAGGITNASATIAFRPLRINLSGKVTGANIASLKFPGISSPLGKADARYSLAYSATSFSARVHADITTGSVNGIPFSGGTADLTMNDRNSGHVDLNAANVVISGLPIRSAVASLDIDRQQIIIRHAAAQIASGRFSASGNASFAGNLNLTLQGSDLPSEALLTRLGYRNVSGLVSFTAGVTGSLANPVVSGTLTARSGHIDRVSYDIISTSISASRESLTIRNTSLRRQAATIDLLGTIQVASNKPAVLSLHILGNRVPVSELADLIQHGSNVSGLLSMDLQATGTLPDIRVSGRATVNSAVIAGQRIDLAELAIHYAGGRTVIDQLFARRGDMQVSATGYVDRDGRLNIGLSGQNLDLSLANEVTRPYFVVEGPFAFSGYVRGYLSNPVVNATINSSNLRINTIPFTSLAASLTWSNGTAQIRDATLIRPQSKYTVSSLTFTPATRTMTFHGQISADQINDVISLLRQSPYVATAEGASLRRLINSLPYPVSGPLSAHLDLSGKLGNLEGGGSITSDNLTLGSSRINHMEVQVLAQRSSFGINRLLIISPGVNLSASARFTQAVPVTLSASIRETNLRSLLYLVQDVPFLAIYPFGQSLLQSISSIPQPIEGTINASLNLVNPMTGATGTLSLQTSPITVQSTPLGTISANAHMINGAIILDNLSLSQTVGEASVHGTINPLGAISLTGTGTNLDLTMLRPWLPYKKFNGALDFAFNAQGSTSTPFVTASFNAHDLSISSFTIDSISSESLTIAAGRLSTPDLVIANRGADIHFSGSIPFAFQRPFFPTDQPIQVAMFVSDPTLNIANSLRPYVSPAHGNFGVNVTATGTFDHPSLNGTINFTSDTVHLRGFTNTFRSVNLRGHFEGESLIIDTFRGSSSLGGTFDANARITVSDLRHIGRSPISAFAAADSLRVGISNLTNSLREKATFTTTGRLITTRTLATPLIQGQLVVVDGLIQLPADVVPTAAAIPPIPVNPTLAVTLEISKNVVIERGALKAQIVGPVTFSGTFPRPVVNGTVQVVTGRLRYVGRTLTITPGGTASFLFHPPAPAVMTIDVTLKTQFSAISPLTNRATRYTIIIDASGPISNPDLNVRSSPPGLSELEALGNAFGGAPYQALSQGVPLSQVIREQLGQLLLGVAIPNLLEPLTLGPLTFGIEPGFGVPLQLEAGAALSERVSISYTRSVSTTNPVSAISFDYSLGTHYSASIQYSSSFSNVDNQLYLILQYYNRF